MRGSHQNSHYFFLDQKASWRKISCCNSCFDTCVTKFHPIQTILLLLYPSYYCYYNYFSSSVKLPCSVTTTQYWQRKRERETEPHDIHPQLFPYIIMKISRWDYSPCPSKNCLVEVLSVPSISAYNQHPWNLESNLTGEAYHFLWSLLLY